MTTIEPFDSHDFGEVIDALMEAIETRELQVEEIENDDDDVANTKEILRGYEQALSRFHAARALFLGAPRLASALQRLLVEQGSKETTGVWEARLALKAAGVDA